MLGALLFSGAYALACASSNPFMMKVYQVCHTVDVLWPIWMFGQSPC
jgi:hypothetical protein